MVITATANRFLKRFCLLSLFWVLSLFFFWAYFKCFWPLLKKQNRAFLTNKLGLTAETTSTSVEKSTTTNTPLTTANYQANTSTMTPKQVNSIQLLPLRLPQKTCSKSPIRPSIKNHPKINKIAHIRPLTNQQQNQTTNLNKTLNFD